MRPTLADVYAARTRIAPHARRTPMLSLAPNGDRRELMLKLEYMQVTGSFKARGALNTVLDLPDGRPLVTASGGNHGLGVAYAGARTGRRAIVYTPANVPAAKIARLEAWGAEVRRHGDVWDDANDAALVAAEREELAYVHPFADPRVIAGQGTISLEILEDAPDIDALVVPIGGGGLLAGMAIAAKALRPDLPIIGVEPVGAPTLHASLAAGRLVTLDRVTTEANTLAPRRSHELNLAIIRDLVDTIVLVDDDAMRESARFLWFEAGIAAELAGAAATAAIRTGQVPGERPCAIVCGVGTAGIGP